MQQFEFSHQIPRHVEFVNGSYSLTSIKTLKIGDESILYCLGEATLDNSCCGITDCVYALVIGKIIETRKQPDDMATVSTISRIISEPEQHHIRQAIQQAEQVQTVNFYIPED